jgi:hypothetical protein
VRMGCPSSRTFPTESWRVGMLFLLDMIRGSCGIDRREGASLLCQNGRPQMIRQYERRLAERRLGLHQTGSSLTARFLGQFRARSPMVEILRRRVCHSRGPKA